MFGLNDDIPTAKQVSTPDQSPCQLRPRLIFDASFLPFGTHSTFLQHSQDVAALVSNYISRLAVSALTLIAWSTTSLIA